MGIGEDDERAGEPVTLDDLERLEAGELSPVEEEQLRRRIAADPAAQRLLERLRRVDSYFPSAPPPADRPAEMPDAAAARIRARARREAERAAAGGEPATGPWDADEDFDPEDL